MIKKRNLFTVLGILPEPGGYSLAKFSRGYPKQTYQDWVKELTTEGAEKFYNTFYFDYGHTSIADMAHITVIVENISTVARMALIDEPLMDVQEVSTRYVNFSEPNYETPPEIIKANLTSEYKSACEFLFQKYSYYYNKMVAFLEQKFWESRPKNMSDDKAERTFNARAFDEARYCLPCAFHTSLGFIINARTAEKIITRLKSHPLQELQDIGEDLKKAVRERPAYSPHFKEFSVPSAPTLVKYAGTNSYLQHVYVRIYEFAQANILTDLPSPSNERSVEMFAPEDDEIDLATTMLFRVLPHSYTQISNIVRNWSKKKIGDLINIAYSDRRGRDPLIRELATGRLTFDVCLDNGAFRDLHRHRNMIHIFKNLTGEHGIDVPYEMKFNQDLADEFIEDMSKNIDLAKKLDRMKPGLGEYILPLAARRRVLFRLDPKQLQYLTELRTTPKGNWSYRDIAYLMFLEYKKRYPLRAKHFRLTNPETTEFWNR
ncbi:FAD-dependent thymidylate synthase [Patescibacteria group bacterium]|nr:FAD-dependent thymidylate synthase [Patescibacteria group bacterium]MBU1868243.1 FAD-dependent thymidylate synthase [Patescibacteria group bacterium]